MRRLLVAFLAIAMGGACTGGVRSSTSTPPSSSTSLSTLASTSTTTTTMPSAMVEGVLPDGQAYVVSGLRESERIESVSVGIAVGIPPFQLIGDVTVSRPDEIPADPGWDGDRRLLPAGDWLVGIDVDPDVFAALGPDARDTIEARIQAYPVNGFAALEIDYPFYFTDARDDPVRIEVRYQTFAIRRSCDPATAAVCSDDGYLQVLPLDPTDSALPDSLAIEATYTGDQVRYLVLGVNTNVQDQQWRIDHATTAEQVQRLWQSYGFTGHPPVIDLGRYVVLFYHRPDDACPDYLLRMHLDDGRLAAKFGLPFGEGCRLPLIPTSYAVSVDRTTVPEQFIAGMFEVPSSAFDLSAADHPVDLYPKP